MDDLQLLKEMRADAPEPDDDRLGMIRVRLAAPTTAKRRMMWRMPSLLAATVAAAVALVLVLGRSELPQPQALPASAAEVLERAALVAGERPLIASPRPGQWLYHKYMQRQPGESRGTTRAEWIRYDGRKLAVPDGRGGVWVEDIRISGDDLSPQQYAEKLRALPTDPAELLAQVQSDRHWAVTGESVNARAFRVLMLYLGQQALMPPKSEAAIYRALAQIPGVRVEPGVRDAMGRPGVGLSYEPSEPGVGTTRDADGQVVTRSYLILAADTYRYLGRRVVWLRDEQSRGGVPNRAGAFYADAELAAGLVDEPGQIP
ncbi:CU044_5270 family protein [Streptosporangium roseum]|uniref:CU044_5270 family protein n=1 Tax=Streptosporangium roseum TaxID=2001 RepID=UPI003318E335